MQVLGRLRLKKWPNRVCSWKHRKRITRHYWQNNCYELKETICMRYLPFIENGDFANEVLFVKPNAFSLDKAESTPPSVHYYTTNLLPTCCRNSKNPAHFYLCGILKLLQIMFNFSCDVHNRFAHLKGFISLRIFYR